MEGNSLAKELQNKIALLQLQPPTNNNAIEFSQIQQKGHIHEPERSRSEIPYLKSQCLQDEATSYDVASLPARLKMLNPPELSWLDYVVNSFSADSAEIKLQHSRTYLSYLVLRLLLKKELNQAESLLKRHNLYESELLANCDWVKICFSRRQGTAVIPNRLVSQDYFGPTQSKILGKGGNYLELRDLNIQEEDVEFIDTVGQQFISARQTLLSSKALGVDTQFTPGKCKGEKTVLNIVQLATEHKVFIFDAERLSDHHQFKDMLVDLFFGSYPGRLVGMEIHEDVKLLVAETQYEKPQQMALIDLRSFVGPSLKTCVRKLFGKDFSKFEQCSAWNIRPLRKAQLHYAALDARVVLEVYNSKAKELIEAEATRHAKKVIVQPQERIEPKPKQQKQIGQATRKRNRKKCRQVITGKQAGKGAENSRKENDSKAPRKEE